MERRLWSLLGIRRNKRNTKGICSLSIELCQLRGGKKESRGCLTQNSWMWNHWCHPLLDPTDRFTACCGAAVLHDGNGRCTLLQKRISVSNFISMHMCDQEQSEVTGGQPSVYSYLWRNVAIFFNLPKDKLLANPQLYLRAERLTNSVPAETHQKVENRDNYWTKKKTTKPNQPTPNQHALCTVY